MNSQIDLIREAFHYRSRYAGSTFVFKIEFSLTLDPSFPSLVKDLSLLAQTGFKIVIVPGAKEWIDSVLAEYGIVSKYVTVEGAGPLRVTNAKAMPFVEMAAFHVATRFMTALSANRCDSVIGNFVRARGLGVLNGQDMEHSGRAEKILVNPIGKVLDSGMVVILPCIGWGSSGKPYNVPSDDIALAAANALNAVKLYIISAGNNLSSLKLPDKDSSIVRLTPKETEEIIKLNSSISLNSTLNSSLEEHNNEQSKGLAELRLALAASKAGVERAHIIDGREEGAILRELFSNLGAGTMIYADEYEAIRPLKTRDIPDVLRFMEPLMQQGILVRRSVEDILEKKEDYWVVGIDGRAHACGALHQYGSQGEIAAIAVDASYADMGLGRTLVRFLIDQAKAKDLKRVFALTTQSQDWFETLGFNEQSIDTLPQERKHNYNHDRKSKVYGLELEE